jgi:CheY-like chemotaxis protein/anti-sigma regulatory factor (Ser/Thr protein kinase)
MTRIHPSPRRLKVLDLNAPFHSPATNPIVDSTGDPSDDDLVSLKSKTLRAPLTDILGFAELIASGELTDEERRLYSEGLLREGRRLTAHIDHALALRRLETGNRDLDVQPVDIRSLIRRAVIAAGLDGRTPINVRVPNRLPLASADAEAVLEVLANFISNARVYSPNGGEITVEARLAGDVVEVSIRDHGVGLEMSDLPQLFKKFYRSDHGAGRRASGAGLGLAINQKIVEALGGQVSVASRGPGKGARFQFTLPVARSARGSDYVLVLEDDAGFASLIRAELAVFGLSTVRAVDAETAQQILVDAPASAVILDLLLPGRQGEDFLADLRTGPGALIPVVVLTGKDLAPDEISALERAGAIAVLPKEAGGPQAAVTLIVEALTPRPVAK